MANRQQTDKAAGRGLVAGAVVRPVDATADEAELRRFLLVMARDRGRPEDQVDAVIGALRDRPTYRGWGCFAPDGQLIALGTHFHQNAGRCYADVDVLPDWRRRGLGSLALRPLVAETARLEARWLVIDIPAADAGAAAFLVANGLNPRGDVWALVAPAETAFPEPVWPSGFRATSFDHVGDMEILTDAFNAAFGDMWGHWENIPGLVTAETVATRLAETDPRGIILALDADGRIAGFCLATPTSGDDAAAHTLDMPGVVTTYRGAGLHQPLAIAGATYLQRMGRRAIRLESWSDPAEIIALYEALGFERVLHEISFGLDVEPL